MPENLPPSLVLSGAVLLAYLMGSIPFGLLIARTQGIDIREHGSKNIGATNVWRVLGKKWGLLTFACDAGKGILAVAAAHLLAAGVPPDQVALAGVLAALGCIMGHSFPVWLGFKGGKGVATSLGVLLGLMPLASLAVLLLWAAVFGISRYVSLASIAAAIALPPVTAFLIKTGHLQGWVHFHFAGVAAALVVWRHRENIRRLAAGTENRFGRKKE